MSVRYRFKSYDEAYSQEISSRLKYLTLIPLFKIPYRRTLIFLLEYILDFLSPHFHQHDFHLFIHNH